jgi:hypothetical protein
MACGKRNWSWWTQNQSQITCTLFPVTPCICSTSLLSRGHEFDTRHPHLPLCDLLAHWSLFQHILEPSHDKRMQYAAENTINSGNKTKVRGHGVQAILMSCRSETETFWKILLLQSSMPLFSSLIFFYLPIFRQLHEMRMRNEAVMV